MKWLIEQIIAWFKGQSGRQAETRADFAAVSTQWESLAIKLTERMERDEQRFDAVEARITQEKKECEDKLSLVVARVVELEVKAKIERTPRPLAIIPEDDVQRDGGRQ